MVWRSRARVSGSVVVKTTVKVSVVAEVLEVVAKVGVGFVGDGDIRSI